MDIDDLLKEIGSYKELEKDWDSYGAEPPGVKACNIAQQILRRLNREVIDYFGYPNIRIRVAPSSKGIHIELTVLRDEKR